MKRQTLFSEKDMKNIISLSSADLDQRVVKIKIALQKKKKTKKKKKKNTFIHTCISESSPTPYYTQ